MLVIPLTLLEMCLCIVSGNNVLLSLEPILFCCFQGKESISYATNLLPIWIVIMLGGLGAKQKIMVHKYKRYLSLNLLYGQVYLGSTELGSECGFKGRYT